MKNYFKNYKKFAICIIFWLFISFSQVHANILDDINNFFDEKISSLETDIDYFIDVKKESIKQDIIDTVQPAIEEKKEEIINEVNNELEQKKEEIINEINIEFKALDEQLNVLKWDILEVDKIAQENSDLWSKFLYMGQIVLLYMGYLISIIVIFKLCVLVLKVIWKFILFHLHDNTKYLQLQEQLFRPKISIKKSIDVSIKDDFYVRYNSILKYGNTQVSIWWFPFWIFNFFAYLKWVWVCDKVSNWKITITSPNHYSFLTKVVIPKWWIFVFNLANLVAFEKWLKIKTKRRIFSLASFLEKKFKFHYVEWPATLYLYWVGEIVTESINWSTSYEKNTIIWFSGNLKRNINIVQKFWSYLFTKNSLKEHFTWKWYIIRQKFWVSDKQLRKINRWEGWWFGFLSDVVGLVK